MFTAAEVPAAFSTEELRRLVEEARTPRKAKQIGTPKTSRVLGDGTGLWRCNDCGVEKPAESFHKIRGGTHLHSYCKMCARVREAEIRRTLRGNVRRLVDSARHRSQSKGWPCNLDIDFVLDLILRQRGRCAYSGVPMEILWPHSDWRMSLERLSNQVGYQQQNCVLIAAEFNTPGLTSKRVTSCLPLGSSKWSREKVQNLRAERLLNIDILSLGETVRAARAKQAVLPPPVLLFSLKGQTQEAPGHLRCSRCGIWKLPQSFTLKRAGESGHRKNCKTCDNEYKVAYRMTLRGHILELIAGARRRHRLDKWQGDFELDLDSVLDMLWSQQGRCFYSDVPLRFAQLNVDWLMSLERLDNSKTYTKENTVLVALEFNTSDNTKKAVQTCLVSGSSQWSRCKVEHVWGRFDRQAFVDPPSLSFVQRS